MGCGCELVPIKPGNDERFGDFIQRLIVAYPAFSAQFRVSPGHTDGVGRSSVALLVPPEVAEDLTKPAAGDDLVAEKDIPPLVAVTAVTEEPVAGEPAAESVVSAVPVVQTLPTSSASRGGRRRKPSATS